MGEASTPRNDTAAVLSFRVLLAGYVLAYALGAYLGQWPTLAPGLTATLWIPSGLTLALLLACDRAYWRSIIVAGFLVDVAGETLIYGFSVPAAFLISAGNLLEPLAGASLILMRCRHPFRFRTLNDVVAFAVLAVLASPMIGATFGASVLSFYGIASFGPAWVLWWLGDAIGVITVAPLALTLIGASKGPRSVSGSEMVEFAVLLFGLAIVSHLWLVGIIPVSFVVLPFVVWAAVRFEIRGASVAIALLAALVFVHVALGYEPFSVTGLSAFYTTIVMQCFLATISTSTLMLAALSESREETIKKLEGLTLELEDRVRQTTSELRGSEAQLRLFIQHAPAALAMFDRDMRYLEVSQRWLTDFALADRNLKGKSHYDVFPEIPDSWKAIHQRALRGEVIKSEDDILVRASGRQQRLRWEVRPWYGADNKIGGILVFSEDITARKLVEDALGESESRLRAIVETALDSIIVIDEIGTIMAANSQTRVLFGYEIDEMVGRNVKMLMTDKDASSHDGYLKNYMENGERKIIGAGREVEGRRKDGATVPLDLAVAEWRDPKNKRYFTGILRDLSERKLAAKTLAASEERLRLALEGAGAAEWGWDITRDRMSWSKRYRELFGFAADEEPSQALWLSHLHSDDRERIASRITAMLASPNDTVWREEFRIEHPERGTIWLAALGRLSRDVHGVPVSMTGISYDITQQRRAEHELRLNQAAQSRLAKLGALGELTAGIAHEINQPLMAAGTFARLTAEMLSEGAAHLPEAIGTARQAAEQIERAAGVVHRLRELIRVGRVSLAPVDATASIETAIEIVRPESERAGVTCHASVQRPLPIVLADELQLEQVMINLLRNSIEAIAASRKTGGRIWISAERESPEFVSINVRDNGPGFSSDQISEMPQVFRTTKPEGLGFGLLLSTSIIKAHGGTLRIDENCPGGSVSFTLRVASGEGARSDEQRSGGR
jgi:PAS domain S-box-containing protein